MTAGDTLTVTATSLALIVCMALAAVVANALAHRLVVDVRVWRTRRRIRRIRLMAGGVS